MPLALGQGIGRGAAVALLMENRPDYICAWLGLFKCGGAGGADQHQSAGTALAHSISISRRRARDRGRGVGGKFSRRAV